MKRALLSRGAYCAFLLGLPVGLHADGGVLLQRHDSGRYSVAVFAASGPARAGVVDLSVLVQTPDSGEPVLDAQVSLKLIRNDETRIATLTRHASQNRLLYSAPVDLTAGDWTYVVDIKSARGVDTIPGKLGVLPSGERSKVSEYWPWLAAPFIAVLFFGAHQRLKSIQKN